MRLCDTHWHQVVKAILDRGLTKWIPDDSAEAHQRWADIRQKGFDKTTYEPIFFAAFAIMFNAAAQGGVNTSEDFLEEIGIKPENCPICIDPTREAWIEHAAQDAYNEALRLGFSPEEMQANPD